VRGPYIERLADRLSDRDWALIQTFDRLRLVTGLQIERLHFQDLGAHSRSVMRWRVLKRLTDARVLMPLDRQIGTARRGSRQLAYTLDSAGQRLARLQAYRLTPNTRLRRPRLPGERFVAHTLAVSELYVSLFEHSRLGGFRLIRFQVEAAWPSGLGGWLRPDALVQLSNGPVEDCWWYEADLATEDLSTTIRGKLLAYLSFVERGQFGPSGVVPRVLIGVPTVQRLVAIQKMVNGLPPPAELMFMVVMLADAPVAMSRELGQS
jgi:protein involved in plasmid replication-relaxation